MPLLITEADRFEISATYTEKDGALLFYGQGETPPPEAKTEKFWFKRPSWSDTRLMMAEVMLMDQTTGQPIMDPYRFMDRKLKVLLKDWSLKLKDDGDEKVPLISENIDALHPALVNYLNKRIDEALSTTPAPK